MNKSDTLLVGFDHANGDIAVLIIGRKGAGESVGIINQLQGDEAVKLYNRLLSKNDNKACPPNTVATAYQILVKAFEAAGQSSLDAAVEEAIGYLGQYLAGD